MTTHEFTDYQHRVACGLNVPSDGLRRFCEQLDRSAEAVRRFGRMVRSSLCASDLARLNLRARLCVETDRRIRRRLKRQLKRIERSRDGRTQNG